jgi:hypothetical protein
MNEEDPTSCLKMLQNMYETQNMTRILYLFNWLHLMKMEEGTSIVVFVQIVKDVVN